MIKDILIIILFILALYIGICFWIGCVLTIKWFIQGRVIEHIIYAINQLFTWQFWS